MTVVVVANPKGGVGKSTLSTQVAAFLASRGQSVALGDIDRQQSSRLWLSLRPPTAASISVWDVKDEDKELSRPPKGVQHAVLDTPAGLHGGRLKEVIRLADKVIVPLQPSIFDMYATQDFLNQLADMKRAQRVEIGIVGMRVDERTIAAERLHEFVDRLGLPVLATLRDTQNYIHLAANGLGVFDVAPGRVAKDLDQWQTLCEWLNREA
ncbi:MAG: ParA family protein [Curvibacter lanceolatus]|uniref:ParA family protein n=1 Tax=Curvibacter lanceolatus TaxID=86182 RepID=UPI0003A03A24|nr:ParA family protein [Curvibacter lanceolatus]MBV5293005.1 ParA family protein [Curvibacter lanceolatus]